MTPLPDYISSNRQRRINALYPKAEPKKIRVYVESTADVSFWHGILQRYEKPYQIKFNIFPYFSEKTTTGKEALKKNFLKPVLN